ncbi:MAG: YihA family ribosome biogenesis GTP-binding protein [Saprospiraceae bacterium]|nr:YihA family ribosome biogenesis GTP-binding protein [Saprospiraceae bacterium]
MKIIDVEYKGSYPSLSKMPATKLGQFAFIGRSNVGKSSMINMLTNRKSLAKVSKQPGKTQMINLFEVDQHWTLVDLPGYGYAKQSKKKRNSWMIMVNNYLLSAPELKVAFVLIDSNIPPQTIDLEFINWMGEKGIPFCIVFTKIDKLKAARIERNVQVFNDTMLLNWESLPPQFRVSSVTAQGKEELLEYIETLI